MSDFSAFLARHSDAESPHIAAARALLGSTAASLAAPSTPVPCSALLPIYAGRAAHLANLASAHARTLSREVASFCDRLRAAGAAQGRWFLAKTGDGVVLLFFELIETAELLGAMRSVDARQLSDDDWHAVWGTPPPPWR